MLKNVDYVFTPHTDTNLIKINIINKPNWNIIEILSPIKVLVIEPILYFCIHFYAISILFTIISLKLLAFLFKKYIVIGFVSPVIWIAIPSFFKFIPVMVSWSLIVIVIFDSFRKMYFIFKIKTSNSYMFFRNTRKSLIYMKTINKQLNRKK